MSCLGAFPLTWLENAGCFTEFFCEHGCLATAVEKHPVIPLSAEGLFGCCMFLRAMIYNYKGGGSNVASFSGVCARAVIEPCICTSFLRL